MLFMRGLAPDVHGSLSRRRHLSMRFGSIIDERLLKKAQMTFDRL